MIQTNKLRSTFVLTPLVMAGMLAEGRPAGAVLTYYIYESGSNVVLETSASLILSSATLISQSCQSFGGISECEVRRHWLSHVIGRAYREGVLLDGDL